MKLAIFDYDGTLIKSDTLTFLLKMWARLGYPKHRQLKMYIRLGGLYLRYKLRLNGNMTTEQIKKTAFQKFTVIFTGMSKQEIKEFFEKCLEFLLVLLNKDITNEIQKAKKEGYYTVLLSGFYQELLALIAQKTGIDIALGTSIIFKDDMIQAKEPMNIKTGTDKVKRIMEEFPDADYENSCAYADSISDLALLELVGTPVAVSPDEELLRIAKERNWRIID